MNTNYIEILGRCYKPPASGHADGDQWNIRNRVAARQRHPGCDESEIHGNTEPCLWPVCDSFKKRVYRESARDGSQRDEKKSFLILLALAGAESEPPRD